MKKMLLAWVGMISVCLWTVSTAANTAYEVMLNAYNLPRGNDRKAQLKMELINKNGKKRTRQVTIWRLERGDEDKSLIYFHKPAADRGTAFLTWEHKNKDSEQWLYLPAVKRIRRIAAPEKHKAFMGTDFSYNDMAPPHPDEFIHKLSGEEELDGEYCYVVESVHKSYTENSTHGNKNKYEYSKMSSWVRKDNYMLIKSKMLDKKGRQYKEFRAHDIKKIDGIWTAMVTEMKKLKSGHRTVFTISDIKYNMGLKESFFTRRELSKER
jgi:outer membrane lipoprotein-sorting protein